MLKCLGIFLRNNYWYYIQQNLIIVVFDNFYWKKYHVVFYWFFFFVTNTKKSLKYKSALLLDFFFLKLFSSLKATDMFSLNLKQQFDENFMTIGSTWRKSLPKIMILNKKIYWHTLYDLKSSCQSLQLWVEQGLVSLVV